MVPCNWKFPAENFGGDGYHVPWSHLSAATTGFSVAVTAKPTTTGTMISPGHGHGVIAVGPKDIAVALARRDHRTSRGWFGRNGNTESGRGGREVTRPDAEGAGRGTQKGEVGKNRADDGAGARGI